MDVGVHFISDKKGRGLIAKRDFAEGEVLFEENPIVCCQYAWNEAYGYLACNHCLRPLESAEENAKRLAANSTIVLPYPECCETNKSTIVSCQMCGVQYCSKECQDLAFQQYHKTICFRTTERNMSHPLEKLTQAWKEMHYPPETGNIMMLARIIAIVQQSSNPQDTFDRFMKFCHRTENEDANLAHKLVGEKFVEQINLLLSILREAMPHDGVYNWLTPEGFRSLLALMATNCQGVGTSAISRWAKNCKQLNLEEPEKEKLDKFIENLYYEMDKESDVFLSNEGAGLFEQQSACNHSCDPNALAHFTNYNFRLSLVAMKDIKQGEEILVSYLDECDGQRSRHTRQKILSEYYLFKCVCEKCLSQADDPDETSEEEMSDSD